MLLRYKEVFERAVREVQHLDIKLSDYFGIGNGGAGGPGPGGGGGPGGRGPGGGPGHGGGPSGGGPGNSGSPGDVNAGEGEVRLLSVVIVIM